MFNYFIDKPASFKNDILSGFTVAISIIPEAIIFSYLAGVPPLTGIYSAIILTLVSSLFGGRPGMISGITSAAAVVMVKLAGEYGMDHVIGAVALAGIIQLVIGAFKLGKFIRLLPRPVVLGYVSGMAISICISQIDILDGDIGNISIKLFDSANILTTVIFIVVGMGIIVLFPRITKTVPSSLVSIVVIGLIAWLFAIDTPTIHDFLVSTGGEKLVAQKPNFGLHELPLGSWVFYERIGLPAIMLATIGLTQSLMTLNFIDELTDSRGNANNECLAQGTGNFLTAALGVVGGGALLGQSVVNIKSGGRFRISGIVTSITLTLVLVLGGEIIGKTPIAAILAVMFMMVIGTFGWSSIRIINKIKRTDAFILIFVSAVTITFNATIGVLLGIVFAALVFSWENAIRIRVRKKVDENGVKHYEIYGPMFFGSSTLFLSKFDTATDDDKNEIVLNFEESRVWDHTGIDAILTVAKKYSEAGKKVRIIHLSRDSRLLLKQTGVPENVEIIENSTDPLYKVVTNFPTSH